MPRRWLRARQWFGAWAVEGVLVSFSVLSAASVGLIVVPVALLVLWWLARNGADGPSMLGAVSGAGVPALALAVLERGPGNLDARPWLAAGVLLVWAGLAGYVVLRRRAESPSRSADHG